MQPASTSTPPRKKAALVTWGRSPSRLNAPPSTTSSGTAAAATFTPCSSADALGKCADMEDLFATSRGDSSTKANTPSPDAGNDSLFLQWTSQASARSNLFSQQAVVASMEEEERLRQPAFDESDLLLEAACFLAETNATRDRALGQLPAQSLSALRSSQHYAKFRVKSEPMIVEDGNSLRLVVEHLDLNSLAPTHCLDLILRGTWMDCKLALKMYLHVCFTKPLPEDVKQISSLVVDDEQHYLVVNPGELISPTKVADAISCPRRVVLKDRYVSSSAFKEGVLGNLRHGLIEFALLNFRFDIEFLASAVPLVVSRLAAELFEIEMSELEARDALFGGLHLLAKWGEEITQTGIAVEFTSGVWERCKLIRVLGIESNVVSEMFGLKGKLDCVCIFERNNGAHRFVAPLEIKTGRPLVRTEHRAQTMLYSLMLADRFAAPALQDGLLLMASFTAHEFKLVGVAARYGEMKELIRIRNSLTVGLPPIHRTPECARCFQKDICALVDAPATVSPYFAKWLEITEAERAQTKTIIFAPYRAASKRCILNLELNPAAMACGTSSGGVLHFTSPVKLDLNLYAMKDGDPVLICLQHAHFGLFQGRVFFTGECALIVHCDDDYTGALAQISPSAIWCLELREYSLASPITALASLVLSTQAADSAGTAAAVDSHKSRVLRLLSEEDCTPQYWDSETNPFIRRASRSLLEHCMGADSMEAVRRDLARFSRRAPPVLDKNFDFGNFTCDQVEAIASVLAARDYLCIAGAPGAGKSTLLIALIHLLSTRFRKSVLVVAATNSACDNIFLKLGKLIPHDTGNLVRIGNLSSVDEALHPILLPSSPPQLSSQLLERHLCNERLVVGVTCYGARSNVLLQRKEFDYCILDEGSQVTELQVIPAWTKAKILILVGDPKQLPPIMKAGGGVPSCLEVLMKKRNSLTVPLITTFRMNADITHLANIMSYDNTLQCGTLEVEAQRLPWSPPALEAEASTPAWVNQCLNPEQSVCFCNTDALGLDLETLQTDGESGADEGGYSNATEAKIVTQLVQHLVRDGRQEQSLPAHEVGVISPYRVQNQVLRQTLSEAGYLQSSGVEVDTVDKYQGREKACIIVSLVRSNSARNTGTLLKDYRRLNVAFTRAKCKLIVVGSKHALSHDPAFAHFFQVICDKQWGIELNKGL